MRYAIISDIHSNLAALECVLQSIGLEESDKIVCLGDLVGYGPFPNECVELVNYMADLIVVGNHDHAAIGLTDTNSFNPYAKAAIDWTNSVLSVKNKEFLKGLDFKAREGEALYVHASPCDPPSWNYVLNMWDARRSFECFDENVCFIGHSHIPLNFVQVDGETLQSVTTEPLQVKKNYRYIVNVGSVGQPRDGNSKAAYVIYDTKAKMIEMRRVEYDVLSTQTAMIEKKLPRFLTDRLMQGR